MVRSVLILLIIVLANAAEAFPTNSMHWNKGVIVLEDRTVITGTICYQHEFARVFMKKGTKVVSYPTQNVTSIRYYDEAVNINRYFVRLNNKAGVDFNTDSHTLFEVVVSGTIQLLRTPKKYTEQDQRTDDLLVNQRNYNYYLNTSGSLIKLADFKQELLPDLLEKNDILMTRLIRENRLDMNDPADCIRLVVLCNQANMGSGVELTAL